MKAQMRTATRRVVMSILAVTLGVVSATFLIASPAAAVGPCGSSYGHIGHYAVNHATKGTVAYIDVYYSSSAKRNCAVLNATGETYGFNGRKGVIIWAEGYYDRYDQDDKDYSYYAGPVYTPAGVNMSGRCLNVEGIVETRNGSYATGQRYKVHCG
ncbi:hypothetical protein AB0B28_08665 [Glycomyces sp. NPDC046736]|uniref:hypothetical protein n=1 Tax=Glycomyces sp. NPDC046736 TaxID=3155615 RepID=UPI0033D8812C